MGQYTTGAARETPSAVALPAAPQAATMAQHPAARRLQRSNSSFRERLEDAGAVLTKSLTIGREAVLDATSCVHCCFAGAARRSVAPCASA